MRFAGNIEAKTDAKGRAFLPSCFRKQFSNAGEVRLIMRKDIFQPCLVLYPEAVWDEQIVLLRKRLNRWNPQHQQLFRQFVADVEMVVLDSNGLFLIPKRYLKMADIQQSIRFIGRDDTIEIWNAAHCEETFMDAAAFGEAISQRMDNKEDNETTSL